MKENNATNNGIPSINVGTVHIAMAVTASSGVARSSHGRNLPRLFLLFAKALSISAPIIGSFTASQMVHTMVKIPITVVSILSTLVQYMENMLAISANVIHPPKSPNIYPNQCFAESPPRFSFAFVFTVISPLVNHAFCYNIVAQMKCFFNGYFRKI